MLWHVLGRVYLFPQNLPRAECYDAPGGDFTRYACLGIPSRPGMLVPQVKIPEAREFMFFPDAKADLMVAKKLSISSR